MDFNLIWKYDEQMLNRYQLEQHDKGAFMCVTTSHAQECKVSKLANGTKHKAWFKSDNLLSNHVRRELWKKYDIRFWRVASNCDNWDRISTTQSRLMLNIQHCSEKFPNRSVSFRRASSCVPPHFSWTSFCPSCIPPPSPHAADVQALAR